MLAPAENRATFVGRLAFLALFSVGVDTTNCPDSRYHQALLANYVLHLVDGVYLGAEYSPEQMGKAARPVPAYADQQRLGAGCQLDAVLRFR